MTVPSPLLFFLESYRHGVGYFLRQGVIILVSFHFCLLRSCFYSHSFNTDNTVAFPYCCTRILISPQSAGLESVQGFKDFVRPS